MALHESQLKELDTVMNQLAMKAVTEILSWYRINYIVPKTRLDISLY